MKKLYVGNLSSQTTGDELRAAFAAFGEIGSVEIVLDRATGQPRGFGFLEMQSDEQAAAAIAALNGKELGGKLLTVNEAHAQKSRPSGRRDGFGGGRSR